MIYDTFPFYNEISLLELRLAELGGVVDRFVLCEAPFTHSGKPKPLYFQENKERFSKFLPKIIHLVAKDFPPADFSKLGESWVYERHQRDWIAHALADCRDSDIVIHGDADEIPSAAAVRAYRPEMGFRGFGMSMHAYWLNFASREEEYIWSKIFPYGLLRTIEPWTMCKIRYLVTKAIPAGGWHFSFMGGVSEVVDKIEAWAHQEYATPEHKDPARILKNMEEGIDPHERKVKYQVEEVDSRYPVCVRENIPRFSHLLHGVPPKIPPTIFTSTEQRTVEWNLKVWENYDWPQDGDEWSEMAQFSGMPYEKWKESLARTFLFPYLRDNTAALEIGPGHGRWSSMIAPRVGTLHLVDLDPKGIEYCRKRLRVEHDVAFHKDHDHSKPGGCGHTGVSGFCGVSLKKYYADCFYWTNDGRTLPAEIGSRSIDFVWSFDTFVHVEESEFRSYVREFARVMKPMGMGVIHHAGNPTPAQRSAGCRSALNPTLVARVLRENGFYVIRQTDSWEGGNVKFANDVITVFAKP